MKTITSKDIEMQNKKTQANLRKFIAAKTIGILVTVKPGQQYIENGFLLTDETTAKIKYKGFQANTESYDPMLERAIVLKLAHKMCYTLTGNMKLKEMLLNQYAVAVDNGASIDGLNSNDDNETITSDLIYVIR